jgi:hypothetical protein
MRKALTYWLLAFVPIFGVTRASRAGAVKVQPPGAGYDMSRLKNMELQVREVAKG